ncbi:MAG TPA: hypothetical protein VL171_07090 [Verrucomicrobiae bacterium]|nr:hypothetical protein [Verrucomicrobiae bacterium]
MTAIEEQLREALVDFMRAAEKKDDVGAALKHVLDLQRQLDADAPPMLRHYLERRSYQKALDFLNSGRPETQTPQCE